MRINTTRLLAAYSGLLTLGLVATALVAAAPRRASFDELDVQRLNVREPDGRLRLAISNHARFPGAIIDGREQPFDRGSAGMIFYDDKATEQGGLIYSGAKRADGVSSGGSLSFDQHRQDEVIVLDQSEEGLRRRAGLTIFDRPDAPMNVATLLQARAADPRAFDRRAAAGEFGSPRAFLGKIEDHSSQLVLRDASGRARLRLSVEAGGAAKIQFLDADGAVTRTIAPA